MCLRMRDVGRQVKPVQFTAQTNSRRPQMLLRLVGDQALNVPQDEALRRGAARRDPPRTRPADPGTFSG